MSVGIANTGEQTKDYSTNEASKYTFPTELDLSRQDKLSLDCCRLLLMLVGEASSALVLLLPVRDSGDLLTNRASPSPY